MINTQFELTNETLANVTKMIKMELTKRGYHTPFTLGQTKDKIGAFEFVFESEPFQTTPVIFESLNLRLDGGVTKLAGTEGEFEMYVVYGRVGVTWQHFNGGSNGTDLFNFRCEIERRSSNLYKSRIF